MTDQAIIEQPEAPQLPAPVSRRGIDEPTWRALTQSVFPGAASQSVLMAWDYCKARRLDPLKKVVHIVPMYVKDAKSGNKEWRDVIMPGIAECRITAHRTGQYAGKDRPVFGEYVDYQGLMVPEWCEVTVYRMLGTQRCPFTSRVFFNERVGEGKDGSANATWKKQPISQIAKCAEAAALREAFPEELGNEPTAEEMTGREIIDATHERVPEERAPTETINATLDKIGKLRDDLRSQLKPASQLLEEENNGTPSE